MFNKSEKRLKRKKRIRSRVFGDSNRPRLSVFKSNKYFYAQIIDDEKGVSITSQRSEKGKSVNVVEASKLGEKLASNAVAKKVKQVVFDRNGYKYHGRVKAFAEGARKGGLVF